MALQARHPLPTDGQVTLGEGHVYTARGKVVPRSVTKLVAEDFAFDAEAIVTKNLKLWRDRASSPYHKLVKDVGDYEAVQNVLRTWEENAQRGTDMHAQCENMLNGLETKGFDAELRQLKEALEAWEIRPVRTELSVAVFDANDDPAVAGQIDLLADVEGEYYICDFKRTTKDLSSGSAKHRQYSLQTSLYWLMLERFTGLKVTGCALIQLHEDLDGAFVVQCHDCRDRARELLSKYGAVA